MTTSTAHVLAAEAPRERGPAVGIRRFPDESRTGAETVGRAVSDHEVMRAAAIRVRVAPVRGRAA
ncbi:hypothetical protein ACWGIN_20920 [Streptomyces sp. NPDC054861]